MLTHSRRLALAVVLICAPAVAQKRPVEWREYLGGPDSSHYSPLGLIDRGNVGDLKVAWTYPTRDSVNYDFNPLIVNGVVYVLARNYSLVALEASTGKEIWIHENLRGISTRGMNYWESNSGKDRRLIFQMNNSLQEIDAATGKSILRFGRDGLVDLRQGLGRDPNTIGRIQSNEPGRIFENLLILGSSTGENYMAPPGDIRAFNVISGKLEWVFHTIPRAGELGYETWPRDSWKYMGGVDVWGEITVDSKRGIVYLPTASAKYELYGGDRPGDNLFANCLLALDARTGKYRWHFQLVHHDIWDYDPVAAPQLLTVVHEGRKVDVVAQAGKQGFVYVFDRVSGKPLWPIEERKVPASDVPGEKLSPTQPFPTAPPPFARQKFTAADIDPYILTPEEQAQWKDEIASAKNGDLYTPPGTRETVEMPGNHGGANWGNSAVNPVKGTLFVVSMDIPALLKLGPEQPTLATAMGRGRRSMASMVASAMGGPGGLTYLDKCAICHGPDLKGGGGPSITNAVAGLGAGQVRTIVKSGRGQMPAASGLSDTDLDDLIAFLAKAGSAGPAKPGVTSLAPFEIPAKGPVVASGGAGTLKPSTGAGQYGLMGGPDYPAGISEPQRLYTGWNLFATIISPPWSTITAYDLNTGTIRWQAPMGEAPEGRPTRAKNSGVIQERNGPVLTSGGLLFAATNDARVRAWDQDTGKVLWAADLPAASEGVPAVYEAEGREYLIVTAASPFRTAEGEAEKTPERAYVVFALPQK